MERQTIIRTAAISFAGIAGTVLFAQTYLIPDTAGEAQAQQPSVAGESAVVLGGVMNFPDTPQPARARSDDALAALDPGVGGASIATPQTDFQPRLPLAADESQTVAQRAEETGPLATSRSDDQSASIDAMAGSEAVSPASDTGVVGRDEFFIRNAAPSANATITLLPAEQPSPVAQSAAPECAPTLSLAAEIDALVKLDLAAPCHPGDRVVVSHSDLVFTAVTDAVGNLSLYVPAFSNTAAIDVLLSDDTHLRETAYLTDAEDHMRVAVQWSGDHSLGLNAFHGNAGFGEAGHLHVANPFDPKLDAAFLIELGDNDMADPMLAQVYSVPGAELHRVRLELEIPVIAANCGQDIMAYVLRSGLGPDAVLQDLQVAMPACDEAEGFVMVPMALPQSADQLAQNR